MKIVIDIPDGIYKKYMDDRTHSTDVLHAVCCGTPLPEHHGRLIDADYMIKQLLSLPKDEFSTDDMWAIKVLNLSPTIIEAEGSESE